MKHLLFLLILLPALLRAGSYESTANLFLPSVGQVREPDISTGTALRTILNENLTKIVDLLDLMVVTVPDGSAPGDLVYFTGSLTCALSDASDYSTARVDGTVKELITGTSARVKFGGKQLTLSGLTPGADYYLSETPGKITATPPASPALTVRVGVAASATALLLDFCPRPSSLDADPSGDATLTLASGGDYIVREHPDDGGEVRLRITSGGSGVLYDTTGSVLATFTTGLVDVASDFTGVDLDLSGTVFANLVNTYKVFSPGALAIEATGDLSNSPGAGGLWRVNDAVAEGGAMRIGVRSLGDEYFQDPDGTKQIQIDGDGSGGGGVVLASTGDLVAVGGQLRAGGLEGYPGSSLQISSDTAITLNPGVGNTTTSTQNFTVGSGKILTTTNISSASTLTVSSTASQYFNSGSDWYARPGAGRFAGIKNSDGGNRILVTDEGSVKIIDNTATAQATFQGSGLNYFDTGLEAAIGYGVTTNLYTTQPGTSLVIRAASGNVINLQDGALNTRFTLASSGEITASPTSYFALASPAVLRAAGVSGADGASPFSAYYGWTQPARATSIGPTGIATPTFANLGKQTIVVDTYGGAAAQDLVRIGGTCTTGSTLYIQTYDNARDVTIKSYPASGGNILTAGGVDLVLDHIQDWAEFGCYAGGYWSQIAYSNN